MSSRASTEERSEGFRKRFSQASEASSSKPLSAASSLHEDDDESFVETAVLYKTWKAQSLALDQETNRLAEVSRRQENEIKELKVRLQAKKNTSSSFTYSERSRSQKISNSLLFTDGKDSIWNTWYEKIQD